LSTIAGEEAPSPGWTFLTNHSHVLICLAQEPMLRLRDVADRVGITERAVQRIVADLEEAGAITREKDGRRNHYQIHTDLPLRHTLESHCTIGQMLSALSVEVSRETAETASR
jgi:DNA-binding IclR family transcriptional regulator